MNQTPRRLCLFLCLTLCAAFTAPEIFGQESPPAIKAQDEAAYTRMIDERAAKIVAMLGIPDAAKAAQVQNLIAQQYRSLREIHDARDARIKAAGNQLADDKERAEADLKAIRSEAQTKLNKLHSEYLSKLSVELTPEEVDRVKDGMTYGVVPLTYGVYLRMYPALTEDQKRQVLTWLQEAREIAMDEGDSKSKHAVFGKYKGRINNYLVKAGYDLKEGERNLKASSQPPADAKTK